jgi:hypothetical protein
MNQLIRNLASAFLLTICIATATPAFQIEHYTPLTTAELGKPFPLKHIADYEKARTIKELSGGVSGIQVNQTEAEEKNFGPIYSGKDRQGKLWSVQLGEKMGLGGNIFNADLDKNGIQDLLFIFPTGGNGLAPSSHILTLMFDSTGRPVPFEAEGYYNTEKMNIAELVDMNRDGRAELVYMNYDDGYWITNIYEASGGRWQRIKGQFGKRTYPLFTRFTTRPNHKAVVPAKGRRPFAPDLSNKTPVLTGRIVAFKWMREGGDAEQSSPGGLFFVLVDAKGRQVSWESENWHGSTVLVLDSGERRKVMALDSNTHTVKALLEEMKEERHQITLYGQRLADKTSPELIWASSRK